MFEIFASITDEFGSRSGTTGRGFYSESSAYIGISRQGAPVGSLLDPGIRSTGFHKTYDQHLLWDEF